MNKSTLNQWRSRYKEWREEPFTYEKKDTEHHVCHNCDNEFVGDYCPTCGLKAESGPITWKTIWQEFLNVWGMGGRSMPYSLWQLLWRPGYFISDYINGRRQVSFPPVKMMFIIGLFYVLMNNYVLPERVSQKIDANKAHELLQPLHDFINWMQVHHDWGMLFVSVLLIMPTWLLFRESPRNTHHTIPQGFFIQVMLSTMTMILDVITDIIPFLEMATFIWSVVALKQLFGYGWWGTIWRMALMWGSTIWIGIVLAALYDIIKSGFVCNTENTGENIIIVVIFSTLLLYFLMTGRFFDKKLYRKHSWWGVTWRVVLALLIPFLLTFGILSAYIIITEGWDGLLEE